jgi:hypothetical protein
MTLKEFDRPILREIQSRLDQAAKQIASDFGISLNVGRVSYSGNAFKASLEGGILASATGTPGAPGLTAQTVSFMRLNNLSAEVRNVPGVGRARIVNFNVRAHKTPWIVEREYDRKRYRIGPTSAKHVFALAA